jgi:hypothetical protein
MHDSNDDNWPAPRERLIEISGGEGVKMPVKLLIGILMTLITGTIAIVKFGWEWKNTAEDIQREIAELKRIAKTGWTIHDEREFGHRLQRDNPTLKIPDVGEVRRTVNEGN